MTPEIPPFQKIVIGIILAFVMASNFGIAVFILKKKFADLKAMNIFQSNYFVGLGLISITAMYVVVSDSPSDVGEICPKKFLKYLFDVSSILDIFILQLDRLVAIGYPYYYNETMSALVAVKIASISKLISLIIDVTANTIDPVYIYCPECGKCNFVTSVNVYTTCYPALAVFLLTFLVSIYVSKVLYKINAVQPVVQLPVISQQNDVLPSTSETDGLEMKPDHNSYNETEMVQEINIDHLLREMKGKSKRHGLLLNMDAPSTSRDCSSRVIANVENAAGNNLSSADTQDTTNKVILRKTLKMNLLTLALIFILVPTQVMIIFHKNCDDSLGECDFLFNFVLGTMMVQLFAGFIHPLVVLWVLET